MVGIVVRAMTGCGADKEIAVRSVVLLMRRHGLWPVRRLTVLVTPASEIYHDGDLCDAVFDSAGPRIIIASQRLGYTALAQTMLHEWVHYEQWASLRDFTERGVAVRARNLMKLLGLDG